MDYDEWDENKCEQNIEKHGFDFIDADALLSGEHYVAPAKTVRARNDGLRWHDRRRESCRHRPDSR